MPLPKNKRALVVDDDPRWHTVYRLMCYDFGYGCTCASDLGEARTSLASQKYDVLILDLGFPSREDDFFPADVSDAEAFLARLCHLETLPVLISTGLTDRTCVSIATGTLASAGHCVSVHHKRDGLPELYQNFARVTGRTPGGGGTGMKGKLPVLAAFASLVLLHFLLMFSILMAARYLPEHTNPLLLSAFVSLLAFTAVVVALLLFWGANAITGRDMLELLRSVNRLKPLLPRANQRPAQKS